MFQVRIQGPQPLRNRNHVNPDFPITNSITVQDSHTFLGDVVPGVG
jgi:hypothetical protein